MRRAVLIAGLAATMAVTTAGAQAPSTEVTMPGKLFAPRDLDVLVGTTVTWRNADTSTHTVTEAEDEFDSGFLRPGGTFSVAFPEQGAFSYNCTIHRFMRGTVHVFQVVLRGPPEPLAAGRRAQLDGVAPAGATEVLLERVTPGPVALVGRVAPGPDGRFTFRVRAPEPRSYRVRTGSASSPVLRVGVFPRVMIERRGNEIAVSVLPARPGSRVVLQEYDRESFDFVTVARARLDSSSRTTIEYAPEEKAHVRVVVRRSGGWSDGFSRTLLVRPR